jgi:succinate-acetate transporter protein
MLNFFKYIFLKEDVFVKENETSFGIFQIFLFVEMESSKLNNYSTNSLFNYNIPICMYIVGFAHYVQAMWIGTFGIA